MTVRQGKPSVLRKTHVVALYETNSRFEPGVLRPATSRESSGPYPTSCVERCSVSVRTELPPSLIPTLPGPAYTDPTIFEQEQARIFEAYWFAAARTADIEGPGSFQTVDVGRENVLLVRGRDRKLRAFLNVCRHRGARVCMEQSGTGQRKLQCGYHAWTYSLDGALVAAPNLTQMDDVDRSHTGIPTAFLAAAIVTAVGAALLLSRPAPPSQRPAERSA